MKKLLVALVAMFAVTAASAQISNAGLRFGTGSAIELAGQYDLSKSNYVDGRIGFGDGKISLSGIYNWKIKSFNWTPSLGKWYFDAGVGAYAYIYDTANKKGEPTKGLGAGVAGQVKLGIKFNDVPVSIAWDLGPVVNITGEITPDWSSGVTIAYHF